MTGRRTEAQEQRDLVRYLDLLGVLYTHPPNGGNRSAVAGARLKGEGTKAGVPDILIFDRPPAAPGARGVAIEMKRRRGGVVTKAQQRWLDELRERGWLARVCRGFDDARHYLETTCGWSPRRRARR